MPKEKLAQKVTVNRQGKKPNERASGVKLTVTPDFPPPSFQKKIVSIQELQRSSVPLKETKYLAIGGGMGSFVWVDHLRIYGVPASDIAVIGFESNPYDRYKRLCENSQIPSHERLRSDSGSCPDNIWGYPGYAVREAFSYLKQGEVQKTAGTLWQVFNEPTFADTYTPRSGDVFKAVDQESKRIGWHQMVHQARVRAIRKTDDGRYAVAYSKMDGSGRYIMLASYVHVAVGYPAVRLLPDLFEYRDTHQEFSRVVNAYEDHEHVYQHLAKHGGTVLVRGRGIVASRIIQRIYETRQVNSSVTLLHLMRTPVHTGYKFGPAQRLVEEHFEHQPFNWPRDCWTGPSRKRMEQATDAERAELIKAWGGTTTADRTDWRQIIKQGLREGWYSRQFGTVSKVAPDPHSNKVITSIQDKGAVQSEVRLSADFIIDATGLISDIDGNPLLKDLREHYALKRNADGRFAVSNDFEIEGMRNGHGRIYASGIITLGGPNAAVDSFLGLQYAALRSVDSLTTNHAPELRYLDGWRSISQWVRWARGVQP